jgi:hypothetical protein
MLAGLENGCLFLERFGLENVMMVGWLVLAAGRECLTGVFAD